MAVYIKGMEMPHNCLFCPVSRWGSCALTCYSVDMAIAKQNRRDDCPLIEVPEPHGRLIDADALATDYIRIRDDGIKEYTQRAIDNTQTIIPASEESES